MRNNIAILLLLTSALVQAANRAAAFETVWTDGIGNWAIESNWSSGPPAFWTDIAIINNGGTAQVFSNVGTGQLVIGAGPTLGENLPIPGHVHVFDSGSLFFEFNPTPIEKLISISAGSTLTLGSGGTPALGYYVANCQRLVNDGMLTLNHAGILPMPTPLVGAGRVLKGGSGTTIISSTSGYTGDFGVVEGTLEVTGSTNARYYSANGGATLRFNSANVALDGGAIFALGSVHYVGVNTIRGGYLRGAGTHLLPIGTLNEFDDVTSRNSTNIIQQGEATFRNFTNGGTLTSNGFMRLDGATNEASGRIIVNGNSLNTEDFVNNGVVQVNSGGVLFNPFTNLVAGGGSRTTVEAGGQIVTVSSAIDLNGALLVNNGSITGPVNINFGSLAKGGGAYNVVNVFDGGVFSPGNSPGQASLAAASFNAGGEYLVEISDAAGAPGDGFDSLNISGGLSIAAGVTPNSRFTIRVASLGAANLPGEATNFNAAAPASFRIAAAGGGINGFSADRFSIDLSGFQNDLAGGAFSLTHNYNELRLNFTPATTSDFDGNGVTDGGDLVRWRGGFAIAANAQPGDGDADADGDVDGADLLVWQRELGGPPIARARAAAVPEPVGIGIWGAVLISLTVNRRQRSRQITNPIDAHAPLPMRRGRRLL